MCAVYVMYYLLSINVWCAIAQVVSCWPVPAGTRFYIRQVCVGLVVEKMTLRQVFCFSSEYLGFLLQLSFHQCSILINLPIIDVV